MTPSKMGKTKNLIFYSLILNAINISYRFMLEKVDIWNYFLKIQVEDLPHQY